MLRRDLVLTEMLICGDVTSCTVCLRLRSASAESLGYDMTQHTRIIPLREYWNLFWQQSPPTRSLIDSSRVSLVPCTVASMRHMIHTITIVVWLVGTYAFSSFGLYRIQNCGRWVAFHTVLSYKLQKNVSY